MKYSEIRTDYIDDNGVRHIDGWATNEDNEQGKTIAYIVNGEPYWVDAEDQFDAGVCAVLKEPGVCDALKEITQTQTQTQ